MTVPYSHHDKEEEELVTAFKKFRVRDGKALDSRFRLEKQEEWIYVKTEIEEDKREMKKKKVFKGIEKMTKKELVEEFKKRRMKIKWQQTVGEMRERLKNETSSQRRICYQMKTANEG